MNLAFCLFKYFPFGGLQRDFLRIAKTCQTRGHTISIYTMKWEGEREPGFHYHFLPSLPLQNHTRIRAFIKKLKKERHQTKQDLVIGFNKIPDLDFYYAADVCYKARVEEKHGWLYRLLPRYKQLVSCEEAVFRKKSQTEIMLISPLQQKEYQKYYATEQNRFHLLPPGITKDRIAPHNAKTIRENKRKALALSNDQFLLLMIGSGFKTKGLDRAIRGLAALPQPLKTRCQLLVIGQDEAAPFLKLAKHLNIHHQIQFLGGRSDVPDFLLAADLLLHPAYHENTGTVLLEAIVSGCPVLATATCGYAHYVCDAKAGKVLLAPFNQIEFNALLQEMIMSPDQSTWRQNGLSFATKADLYSMPEKAADLIEEMGRKRGFLSA